MPIKSYIVHPQTGMKDRLTAILNSIKECEVVPAVNENILVLVTETKNKMHETRLFEKLNEIECLSMLSLVSGFSVTPKD